MAAGWYIFCFSFNVIYISQFPVAQMPDNAFFLEGRVLSKSKSFLNAGPATENFLPETSSGAARKRHLLSIAKKNARPGPFEKLGSFDRKKDDAELFGNDQYRRMMNLLIHRSLT